MYQGGWLATPRDDTESQFFFSMLSNAAPRVHLGITRIDGDNDNWKMAWGDHNAAGTRYVGFPGGARTDTQTDGSWHEGAPVAGYDVEFHLWAPNTGATGVKEPSSASTKTCADAFAGSTPDAASFYWYSRGCTGTQLSFRKSWVCMCLPDSNLTRTHSPPYTTASTCTHPTGQSNHLGDGNTGPSLYYSSLVRTATHFQPLLQSTQSFVLRASFSKSPIDAAWIPGCCDISLCLGWS